MAIAVVYRPPAMTAEQYEASWRGGAPPVAIPEGLVFHAGVGEGGEFLTMTVWESREAYDIRLPAWRGSSCESHACANLRSGIVVL
jgi:hypothetical protein